jgi:hypothetical protein
MERRKYIVVLDDEDASARERFLQRLKVLEYTDPQDAPTIYGQDLYMVGIECNSRMAGYVRNFPDVLTILRDRPARMSYETPAARVNDLIAAYETEQADLNVAFDSLSSIGLQVQMSNYIQGDHEVGLDKYNVERLCNDMGIRRSELREIILADTGGMWTGTYANIDDYFAVDKIRQMILIWHEVLCQIGNFQQARLWMRQSNPLCEQGATPIQLIAADRMFEAYCLAIGLDKSECA